MSSTYVDPVEVFEARQNVSTAPAPAFNEVELAQAVGSLPAYQGSGRVSINTGNGTVTDNQTASFNAHQSIGDGSTGVVLSGRSQTGSPRAPSELKPDDLVLVKGTPTTVRNAERLGFLEKDATGHYRDVASPPDHNEIEKPPEARKEVNEGLDDKAADEALSDFCTRLDAGTQVRGMLQLIDNGELSESTMMMAATTLGVRPGEFQTAIKRVVGAFDRQARRAVESAGVEDAGEFFAWADANHRSKFTEARRRHGMERTTSGYTGLVKDFLATRGKSNPGGTARTIKEDLGLTTRIASNGEVLVNIPKVGEMSYEAAIRVGFIKAR